MISLTSHNCEQILFSKAMAVEKNISTLMCGLSLTDIFSQTIDKVFLDELLAFQG